MTRFGWTLVCPKCYDKPGHYYGRLKVPSERLDMSCPNCGTRLVDVARVKAAKELNGRTELGERP